MLNGEFDKAEGIYKELLKLNPGINLAPVYYFLGKIYREKHDYVLARKYYYLAADTGSKRPSRAQNEAIKRIAVEHKVSFVDTFSSFEKTADNALIGYNLFGDAHHPNLKGYILLAGGFAEELGKIYNVKPAREKPSEEEIKNYFGFDNDDMFVVYMHNIKWLLAEASKDVYRRDSIERAKYYLAKAKENYESSPSINKKYDIELSWLMIAALSRDLKGVTYWLKRGEFLTKNRYMIETKNDFFNSWLKNTLFEVELPEDIKKELNKGRQRQDQYSNDKVEYIIP
jgi:tetratricopeptide (TPR) repeat protein